MSKLEQLKEKAKSLEARDPRRAVDFWLEALKMQESDGEPNPDLSIYNRIGDLYIKLKEPAQAADWYDRAVDLYAELGFHNNAIAMCNKVLRNAPARQGTYLKLAKLYAAKGFMSEAKQNFLEYAERMQRAGKIDQAFAALREFTDISPESDKLREILAEHLQMYGGDVGRRPSAGRGGARPGAPPPPKPAPEEEAKSDKRKTSNLVFLDLDEPSPRAKAAAKSQARPAPPPAPPAPPPRAKPPRPEDALEIETTSLVEEEDDDPGSVGRLEGLETTHADFGQTSRAAPPTPSIRDDVTPADIGLSRMKDLEPTAAESPDAGAGLDQADLVFDGNLDVKPPKAGPKLRPLGRPAPPPEPPRVKPVLPKRPASPSDAPPGPKRKLEPDFETRAGDAGPEVDDEPLVIEEGHAHPSFVQTEDDTSISEGGRPSGFINLGVDGVVNQGDQAGSLVFSNIEDAPGGLDIDDLEARVADNPDDPEAHRALGEALIEAGERERGIQELDLATAGFENAANLSEAQDLVDEILRLDPNSVRHRQKAVEFAFKAGDKERLVDAYLELADALLRSDLPDKARAVYERVAEHDPKNERARAALAMLAPPAPGAVSPARPEGKVKAKDAKMTVRDEAAVNGDFVDLGAMLSDDEHGKKDTRITVEDEEPTGDEEQDFHDMLARFKQGIDENIDEADFQSHYDLGVAFKEMGLLDEAIAEFQKALRAPEGKLRTSEMLGVCFFEKGAFGVAESILRRGLDLPASGDQERLGILYWLGRALEQQGKKTEARDFYGRVFAVDIRFLDAEQRVKALAKAK